MHNTSSSKRLSQALSDDNLVIVERGDVQFTLVVGAELPLAACVLSSLCDGDFQTPDITVTTSGGATGGGDTSLQMLECRDPQPHPLFNLQVVQANSLLFNSTYIHTHTYIDISLYLLISFISPLC